MFGYNFLLMSLLLLSYLFWSSNASSLNDTKYISILVNDAQYIANSVTKNGFGNIVCNKTKFKDFNQKLYETLKTESKTDECDVLIDLISNVEDLKFKNKNCSKSIDDIKSSFQKELEGVMKDKLTCETESDSRIKTLEKENAHLKRLLGDYTLKKVVCGRNDSEETNGTIYTTVNDNTVSTACSNYPIIAAGLNPSLIFIIGITLCGLGIIFILITAGYVCRKRSKYHVRNKPKLESPKIEPLNRASNASSIFATELSSTINLRNKSVNNNPGITLKIDEPDIPQISLHKSDRVSTEMESTENTGIA